MCIFNTMHGVEKKRGKWFVVYKKDLHAAVEGCRIFLVNAQSEKISEDVHCSTRVDAVICPDNKTLIITE